MKNRQQRVRYKTKKVSSRNRLTVFRSNNHIYAQLIDDSKGITLASSSSIEKSIKDKNLNNYNYNEEPDWEKSNYLQTKARKNTFLFMSYMYIIIFCEIINATEM